MRKGSYLQQKLGQAAAGDEVLHLSTYDPAQQPANLL